MGIVVRELFAEFGAKYQMRLLAGEKGLNRVMDWVHIIQFCEKKAFPVFSVPWKVHLVDMTRDFSTRVNEKEFEELNLTEAVRNAIFYSSQPNTYLPYMKRGGYSEKEKFQAAVFYLQADVRQFPDMRFRNRLIRSRIGNDQKKTVMFDQEGLVVSDLFWEDVEKSQEAMESLADFAASRNLEFSGGMGEIVTAAEEIVKTYEQAVQARRLAQEHFCHRNTVTYRLNRISQLLGINMESMKEKEELMLAFQILDCVGEEDT